MASQDTRSWPIGFVLFAGVMMVVVGTFQALQGLAAIIKDNFFVVTPQYAFNVDVTTWGWIHLILGILVILAGIYVFSGKLWARIIGIILALASAVSNFLFIPHYPIWALLIIAIDVFVIYALAVAGESTMKDTA